MHPTSYIVGPLPREASGKINKKALVVPATAASVPLATRSPVSIIASGTESELLKLFSEVLHQDVSVLSVDDSFFELGGNSLLAARLLIRLNKDYNVALPLNILFSHSTVRLLASTLGLQTAPAPATTKGPPGQIPSPQNKTPLSKIQEGEIGKKAIFCVHPAGGNAMCFYPLALEMRQYPVYVLEDQNESDDETYSYKSITHMAEEYVNAIKTVQPEGPYFLLGFSMGGAVAYTMASVLESRGDKVAMVMGIDCRLRGTDASGVMDDAKIAELLLNRLEAAAASSTYSANGNGLSTVSDGRLSPAKDNWQKIEAILSTLVQRIPQAENASASNFALRFVALFRKHLQLLAAHAAPTCSANTVVMLCKTDDTPVIEQEWRQACKGQEEIVSLPAAFVHNEVMYQPCIKYAATILKARLEYACLNK